MSSIFIETVTGSAIWMLAASVVFHFYRYSITTGSRLDLLIAGGRIPVFIGVDSFNRKADAILAFVFVAFVIYDSFLSHGFGCRYLPAGATRSQLHALTSGYAINLVWAALFGSYGAPRDRLARWRSGWILRFVVTCVVLCLSLVDVGPP